MSKKQKRPSFQAFFAFLHVLLQALHALRTCHIGATQSSYSLQLQLANQGLTHQERKELMEKGPFNLVFHGLKPDWIEDEMDDDPEFKRDVLEQRIRTLIRDQVSWDWWMNFQS